MSYNVLLPTTDGWTSRAIRLQKNSSKGNREQINVVHISEIGTDTRRDHGHITQ